MKRVLIAIIMCIPILLNAQSRLKRYTGKGLREDLSIIKKADALAYKKACKDSIYSYDVFVSYLKDKNLEVDEVTEDFNLKDIFKRVVIKHKKIKDEDKAAWKQEFYNYEFEKNLLLLKQNRIKEDSLRRNDWSESDTYIALKLFSTYQIPQQSDNILSILDNYEISVDDIFSTYNYFRQYDKPRKIAERYAPSLLFANPQEIKIKDADFDCIQKFLKRHLKDLSTAAVYKQILSETNYINGRNYSGIDPNLVGSKKIMALFELDKNNNQIQELENLIKYWNDVSKNRTWEKYVLSSSMKFEKTCSNLNDALFYRKNHPLTDGVLRFSNYDEKNKKENTRFVVKEIPYKVIGDSLIVDGTCMLNVIEEQYPHADGDWYKKYTMNVKVYIVVKNGVAISRKFTGTHKVWGPDKRVFDKTKGGLIQKTASTLAAKPAVVKTNDMSKVDNTEIILSSNRIEELLRLSNIDNVSLDYLCKQYIKYPNESKYLEGIKMPIKNIDFSKLK